MQTELLTTSPLLQYLDDREDNLQSGSLISTFVTVLCAIQIGYAGSEEEGSEMAKGMVFAVNISVLVYGMYAMYCACAGHFSVIFTGWRSTGAQQTPVTALTHLATGPKDDTASDADAAVEAQLDDLSSDHVPGEPEVLEVLEVPEVYEVHEVPTVLAAELPLHSGAVVHLSDVEFEATFLRLFERCQPPRKEGSSIITCPCAGTISITQAPSIGASHISILCH